jgi:hypothetical protein
MHEPRAQKQDDRFLAAPGRGAGGVRPSRSVGPRPGSAPAAGAPGTNAAAGGEADPKGYATGWGVAWLVAVACGSWAAGEGDLLDAVLRGLAVGGGVMALWVTGLFLWTQGLALNSHRPNGTPEGEP